MCWPAFVNVGVRSGALICLPWGSSVKWETKGCKISNYTQCDYCIHCHFGSVLRFKMYIIHFELLFSADES